MKHPENISWSSSLEVLKITFLLKSRKQVAIGLPRMGRLHPPPVDSQNRQKLSKSEWRKTASDIQVT